MNYEIDFKTVAEQLEVQVDLLEASRSRLHQDLGTARWRADRWERVARNLAKAQAQEHGVDSQQILDDEWKWLDSDLN